MSCTCKGEEACSNCNNACGDSEDGYAKTSRSCGLWYKIALIGLILWFGLAAYSVGKAQVQRDAVYHGYGKIEKGQFQWVVKE